MPITHSNAASQATPKMVMDEIHNNDAVSNDWKEGRIAEDAKSSLSDALEEAFSSATQHNRSKDSLVEALDAIVEDADNGKEQETKANEKDPVVDEDSPVSDDKENKDADKDAPSAPKLADEPDEDGLVYVSMTFKIDPTKYRSANYKPLSPLTKDAAKIGKNNPNAVNKDDEPTPSEEEIAAEEADAKSEDLLEGKDNTKKVDREANDSALDDDVVSSPAKDSYPCALPECGYNGGKQDLSKTAMDVRPRPTRQTCQTTFAQCRAENPLFCRFHGPKLLEADIRGTMRALGIRGQVLVTKVPNTDNTFKVTVGCRPSDKEQAKSALRWYSEQMGVTGITNTSDINDIGANGGIGREFQMDLLRADRAPSRQGKEAVANLARNRAVEAGRTMPVVGEEQPPRQRRPRREQAAAQPEPQPQQEPVQEQPAPQPEQPAEQQAPRVDTSHEPLQRAPGLNSEQRQETRRTIRRSQFPQWYRASDTVPSNRRNFTDEDVREAAEIIAGDNHDDADNIFQYLMDVTNGIFPQEHIGVSDPIFRYAAGVPGATRPTQEQVETAARRASEYDSTLNGLRQDVAGNLRVWGRGRGRHYSEHDFLMDQELPDDDPVRRYIDGVKREMNGRGAREDMPRPTDEQIVDAAKNISKIDLWRRATANCVKYGPVQRLAYQLPEGNAVRDFLIRSDSDIHGDGWSAGERYRRAQQARILGLDWDGNVSHPMTPINGEDQQEERRADQQHQHEQQQSVEQAAETPNQQPQPQAAQHNQAQGGDNGQQGQIEHYDGGVKARFSPSERQAIEREMGRAMRVSQENPDDIEARSYAHTLSHLLGSRDSAVGRRNHALAGIRDNITKAELLEKAENRLRSSAHHHEKYHGAERAIRKIAELSGIENLEVQGDRIWIEGQGNGGEEANRRQEANEQERQRQQPNRQQGNGNAAIQRPTTEEITEAFNYYQDRSGRDVGDLALLIAGQDRLINNPSASDVLSALPLDNAVRRYIENTTPEYRMAFHEAAMSARRNGNANSPQGNEDQPQSAAPANNPPRMPTSAEMDSVAAELADRRGWPVQAVRGTIEGIVRGDVSADDYRNEILTIPNDNPVRQYIDHMTAVARAQAEEAGRQAQEEADANKTREISDISSEEALRRVVPARMEASREEVVSTREANRIYWADGGMHAPTKAIAMEGAIAANTSGLSQEVFDADHAVQREVMPGCRTFNGGRAYEGNVFASQSRNHGCNCWKAVAASLLRLRGFKVKARTQEEASPVFANTPARGGGQKISFKTSQEAMLKAYERVNEDSERKAYDHIKRIVEGNDGRDGSQPTLPYPDGTFISTWNGGHCTGAVLYKGKLFKINPFYGEGYSETSVDAVVSSMCNVSGPTYKYEMLDAVGRYRRDKAYARARGQRFQLDPDSEDKTMVLHFLGKQKELRRTNRNVTDEQVADACSRDELWRNINGSFVIRPDEPLIPALFGLAKPSTT